MQIKRFPEPKHPQLDSNYKKLSKENDKCDAPLPCPLFKKGNILADIACGSGQFAHFMAHSNPQCRVIGIDLDEEAIKTANQRFRLPNLTFEIGEAHAFMQRYASRLDFLNCKTSLHHFDNLNFFINLACNAIALYGFMVIKDFDRNRAFECLDAKFGRKLYEWRCNMDDEKFLDTLKRFGYLENPQVNSYLSVMAAYTPEEVQAAVQKQGKTFEGEIISDKHPSTFTLLARRTS